MLTMVLCDNNIMIVYFGTKLSTISSPLEAELKAFVWAIKFAYSISWKKNIWPSNVQMNGTLGI